MITEIETTDVVVRDGSTVCVRRTTSDDVDALSQFFHTLSTESLYYRFIGLPALTPARLRELAATGDDDAGMSLVVESAGRIVAFAGFYALFVVACAVHVPIGLRAIALEWLGWREPVTNATAIGIAVVIAFLGLRAVVAVFAG